MAIPTLSLNSTTGTISSSSLRSLNFAEKPSSVATSATSSRRKPPSLLADAQPALISSPSEGVHFANRSYASRPAEPPLNRYRIITNMRFPLTRCLSTANREESDPRWAVTCSGALLNRPRQSHPCVVSTIREESHRLRHRTNGSPHSGPFRDREERRYGEPLPRPADG